MSTSPAARRAPRRSCRDCCCCRRRSPGRSARPARCSGWPAAARGPPGRSWSMASARAATRAVPATATRRCAAPPGSTRISGGSARPRSGARRSRAWSSPRRPPICAGPWPSASAPGFAKTTQADMPTFRTEAQDAPDLLRFLKEQAPRRFRRLEDLTAIDERQRRHASRARPSPWSTTCSPSTSPATCGSRCRCTATSPKRRRPPGSGVRPTGTSAKPSTCSASASPAIPTCAAFSWPTAGRVTRCARSTRRAPPRWPPSPSPRPWP